MMKKLAIALAVTLTCASYAHAEGNGNFNGASNNGNGNRGTLNGNLNGNNLNSSSKSRSRSNATASYNGENYAGVDGSGNSSNTFKDRLQAPSFGVGSGYCSNGFSVSVPGGGLGWSSMTRMCQLQIGTDMVNRYMGKPNAAAYMCNQREFAYTVPACIRARKGK